MRISDWSSDVCSSDLFFEGSLEELAARNPDIRTRFRRIDANAFGCVVYRNGKTSARCGVRRGSGFGNGIAFSQDDNAPSNTMNEELTPATDEQSMWLRPIGMQLRSGSGRNSKLTPQGAILGAVDGTNSDR